MSPLFYRRPEISRSLLVGVEETRVPSTQLCHLGKGPGATVDRMTSQKPRMENRAVHRCDHPQVNVADVQKSGRQRAKAYDGGCSPMLLTSINRRKRQAEYFQ
jgi:hypothetical protein